ncbi:hypothetical protein CEXT_191631 [Caerostris extrusa]|uniref:Uncharacterized protein n=1 Tax=Caerostris extrusa TaxID=172846 RepID=A0AAV4R8C9_CAEEX|nr:hypothetical protein CEXT_191631 [Caerostris extrusa]
MHEHDVVLYGIKKKEEVQQEDPFADMEGSSLNRKRKTPAELAAEAEAEDQDEFTSESPLLLIGNPFSSDEDRRSNGWISAHAWLYEINNGIQKASVTLLKP